MSEYLNTDVFVHKRDENENLLPIDVPVPQLKGKIKILPMSKGEINKLRSEMKGTVTTEEQDKQLIRKHIIEPKFSDKDFEFFKPLEYNYLVTAIFVGSGIPKEKIEEAAKLLLEKNNPLLK